MCGAISGLGTLWGIMLDFAPAAEATIISSVRSPRPRSIPYPRGSPHNAARCSKSRRTRASAGTVRSSPRCNCASAHGNRPHRRGCTPRCARPSSRPMRPRSALTAGRVWLRAWSNPAFKQALLDDPQAVRGMGHRTGGAPSGRRRGHATGPFHGLSLCSCHPGRCSGKPPVCCGPRFATAERTRARARRFRGQAPKETRSGVGVGSETALVLPAPTRCQGWVRGAALQLVTAGLLIGTGCPKPESWWTAHDMGGMDGSARRMRAQWTAVPRGVGSRVLALQRASHAGRVDRHVAPRKGCARSISRCPITALGRRWSVA